MQSFLALFLILGFFLFLLPFAQAEDLSSTQLIDLFVSLGIISAEKAQIARQALVSHSVAVFTKDLSLGINDLEVLELQKTLNLQGQTKVSDSGPGSPEQETAYFGPKTQIAVIKFQELYASEILLPNGFMYGTGYVGQRTRNKLNALRAKFPVSASSPAPVSSIPGENLPVISKELFPLNRDLVFAYPSSYEGISGDTITLHGFGFTQTGNSVYLGNDYSVKNTVSSDGVTISFKVPSDIPGGVYPIAVSNNAGKRTDFSSFFVVKEKGVNVPNIDSISPISGPYGTQVVVTGSGFTSESNDIYTNTGIIKNISSDGHKLTFRMSPAVGDSPLNAVSGWTMRAQVPVRFFIVNAHGVSKKTLEFTTIIE